MNRREMCKKLFGLGVLAAVAPLVKAALPTKQGKTFKDHEYEFFGGIRPCHVGQQVCHQTIGRVEVTGIYHKDDKFVRVGQRHIPMETCQVRTEDWVSLSRNGRWVTTCPVSSLI